MQSINPITNTNIRRINFRKACPAIFSILAIAISLQFIPVVSGKPEKKSDNPKGKTDFKNGNYMVQLIGSMAFQHENPIKSMALSPDETRLVTLSKDEVFVWNTETGKLICNFPTKFRYHDKIWFDPDEKIVNCLKIKEGGFEQWNIAKREYVLKQEVGIENVIASDYSKNLKYMVYTLKTDETKVYLLDLKTNKVIHTFGEHKAKITKCHLSDNGKYLATSDEKGFIHIRDFVKRQIIKTLDTETEGGFTHIEVTPNGKYIIVGVFGKVLCWDIENGKKLDFESEIKGSFYDVVFSADEITAYLLANQGPVLVWDVDELIEVRRCGYYIAKPHTVCFTNDGLSMIGVSENLRPLKFNMETGEEIKISPDSKPYSDALSILEQTNKALIITSNLDLLEIDLASGEEKILSEKCVKQMPIAMTVSKDGNLFGFKFPMTSCDIWELKDNKRLQEFNSFESYSLVIPWFAKDGRHFSL